jgi:hypothetical protein
MLLKISMWKGSQTFLFFRLDGFGYSDRKKIGSQGGSGSFVEGFHQYTQGLD